MTVAFLTMLHIKLKGEYKRHWIYRSENRKKLANTKNTKPNYRRKFSNYFDSVHDSPTCICSPY